MNKYTAAIAKRAIRKSCPIDGKDFWQRQWPASAVLLALTLPLQGGDAVAGEKRAVFAVTTNVVAVTKVSTREQVPVLTITPADIQRGYVDAPDATLLDVTSNSRTGYLLDFYAPASVFRAIRVKWGGTEAEIGSDGGTVAQRNPVPGKTTMRLSYRFLLAEGLLPGDYSWPLMVSARPL